MKRIQKKFIGNIEHLKIITDAIEKNNIKIWNNYINDQGNKFRANLSGINLIDSNLKNIDFNNAILDNSDLTKVQLINAKLNNTSFYNSELSNADLSNAEFIKTKFIKANLENAKFNLSDFFQVDFTGAKLIHTIFSRVDLYKSVLINCDLRNAEFRNTSLHESILTGSKLHNIKIFNWNIKNIICKKASWDNEGEKYVYYKDNEFEKLFSIINLDIYYPDFSDVQYYFIPAMIAELNKMFDMKYKIEHINISRSVKGENNLCLSIRSLQDNLEMDKIRNEFEKSIKGIIISKVNTHNLEIKKLERKIEEKDFEIIKIDNEKKIISEKYLSILEQNHFMRLSYYKKSGKDICGNPMSPLIKNMAIFFSDIKGFSNLGKNKVEIINKMYNHFFYYIEKNFVIVKNTWGDAVYGLFDNVEECIKCLLELQKILYEINIRMRVGIHYGEVELFHNRISDSIDAISSSIDFAARLEPLCDRECEILISEKLFKKIEYLEDMYKYEKVRKILKKGTIDKKEGTEITAYFVSIKN